MTLLDVDAPPAAPARAVAAALGLGAAAAVLLPGGPPGVGAALLALLAAVVLHGSHRATRWQAAHGALAVLLAGAAVLRDAPWVVALDLLAALALGCLALLPATTWTATAWRLVVVPLRLPTAAGWLGRGAAPLLARGRDAGPVLRGGVLTALLLAVFAPLLASADGGFADLLGSLSPSGVRTDVLTARVVVLVVVALGVAACAHLVAAPSSGPELPPPSRLLVASEGLPPLAALDLLLAAFLLVQRGADLSTGSYADAVHAGFWQLVVVTGLVLLVVAAAVRWTPLDRGARGARGALGALCLLTLAVDASALGRLRDYTDAYGLTRLRVLVAVVCLVLAAMLVLVLLAGVSPVVARSLAPLSVAVTAGALLVLTAVDPDAAIARSALDRVGTADLAYLSTLSADAVPELDRLPEPARSCALRGVVVGPSGWSSANVARARARGLLAARPVGVCPR